MKSTRARLTLRVGACNSIPAWTRHLPCSLGYSSFRPIHWAASPDLGPKARSPQSSDPSKFS